MYMKESIVNIKVNSKVKKQAQAVAEELGFSLSSILNAYLKELIKSKTVHFSAKEEPSEWFKRELIRSEDDIKAGRVASFKNPEEALAYLDKMIADEEWKYKH